MGFTPTDDGASPSLRGVDCRPSIETVFGSLGYKLGPPQGALCGSLESLSQNSFDPNTLAYMLGTSHINLNQNEHVKHTKAR